MDLSYGPEYETFRQEVRAFLDAHGDQAPRGQGLRAEQTLIWQQLLIKHGYTARTIPTAYGGFGAEPDILRSRIIAEEFATARVSQGLGGQGIGMLVPTLLEVGTEEQKQTFIAPTIRGEMVWYKAYSSRAGSDLASLRTSAVLEQDEHGEDVWTSMARRSGPPRRNWPWIFCLVRTEPQAPSIRNFLPPVPHDTLGIEIRPLVDMTGQANFNEVFFTDVRVPATQIVGNRGDGWRVANTNLGHERDSLGNPNATLQRLNALTEIMKEETIGGMRLIDHPTYRDRLMQLQGRVMAMRFNDMRVLSAKLNDDQDASLARMIVKLQGTELRHELEGFAIDIMGELGLAYDDNPLLRDHGSWQSQYMYFLGLIIGGGTSQIQKNIISERGLGMPREPKIRKEGTA